MADEEQAEVRVPAWLVGLLITTLFAMLSVVFSMGMTYMRLVSDTDRIEKLERQLEEVNGRLNQVDQHLQSNLEELQRHEQELIRIERKR